MSCCNQSDPAPTQAKECDAIPSLYDCADDGTFTYNLAKRLRWFSSRSFTATCGANSVGTPVTQQATVTSSISQADADANALLRAEAFADASLFCEPLFWTSTQSFLYVCPDREDVYFAATVTAVSWLGQEHADAKAYGQALETVDRIKNCCVGGPFSKTISATATCTTGPSSPFASATAEVTASSCISELNAWQIAENEAQRAAQLALACDYPDWGSNYFTNMKRCEDQPPAEFGVDPCNPLLATSESLPPVPELPAQCPVCLLYLRMCSKIIGITNVGCTVDSHNVAHCNYPPGVVQVTDKCTEIQIDSVTIVRKCNVICVLNIEPNTPPGCESCENGYGLATFLFGSGLDNPDCNVLGFYCCGKQNCAFGFCECYSPCCIGDLFCVEY